MVADKFGRGRDRAASPTIRGYVYQFNQTIEHILRLSSDGRICVEGYEDLDLEEGFTSESIQCKYLAAGRYSKTGMRSAIIPMLRAFVGGRRRNYRLIVYYRDFASAPEVLTVSLLRDILTEKKRKPEEVIRHCGDISDRQLGDFLDNFTLERGRRFEEQKKDVQAALGQAMGDAARGAPDLYYVLALDFILEHAMKREKANRVVTRADLLSSINVRPQLFAQWHDEFLTKEQLVTLTIRRMRKMGILGPLRRRILILDASSGGGGGERTIRIGDLVELLSREVIGSKDDIVPWTVVLDGTEEDVTAVKKRLADRGVLFNDGYESLSFNSQVFRERPIFSRKRGTHKIERASFGVRIVGLEAYENHGEEFVEHPASIVRFSGHPSHPIRFHDADYVFDLPTVDFQDILRVLREASTKR